jgi:stage IV sporulation protein FB
MTLRENPLFWSFNCGTCFLTRVRISFYLPLLAVLLSFQLDSLRLGLIISSALLVSLILHEFAHVFAARVTGGMGSEILIWPLGGLSYIQPGPSRKSHLLVALAGPIVNLVLVVLFLPATLNSGFLSAALNPFQFPQITLTANHLVELQVLFFKINWLLLLINILPVYPLDGSKIIQAFYYRDWNQKSVHRQILAAGMILISVGMISGLAFSHVWLVFTSSVLLILNFYEIEKIRFGEHEEDSHLENEYGYSGDSFEIDEDPEFDQDSSSHQGLVSRWMERRERQKRKLSLHQEKENARLTDQILEKVHQFGLKSLTADERQVLDRASDRLKRRTSQSDDSV